MLRALGIAFIVCTAMFVGLIFIGLGWWAIASGTVQIAGINKASQNVNPAPVQVSEYSSENTATQPPIRPELSTNHHSHVPFHTASQTVTSASVTPLSTASAVIQPQPVYPKAFTENGNLRDLKPDISTALRKMKLLRTTAPKANSFMSWARSSSDNPNLFESGTKQLTLFFEGPSEAEFRLLQGAFDMAESDGDDDLLKNICVLKASARFDDETALFSLTYDDLPVGNEQQLGIVQNLGANASTQVLIAGAAGGLQRPKVLAVYNGLHQPEAEPLKGSLNDPVSLPGPFVRFNVVSQQSPEETQLLIMPHSTDDRQTAADQLTTVRTVNATPNRLAENLYSIELSNESHFNGFTAGKQATLWIAGRRDGRIVMSEPITLHRTTALRNPGVTVAIKSPSATSAVTVEEDVVVSVSGSRIPDHLDLVVSSGDSHIAHRITAVDGSPYHASPSTLQGLDNLSKLTVPLGFTVDGPTRITATLFHGTKPLQAATDSHDITVFRNGPTVRSLNTADFVETPKNNLIVVNFDPKHPLTEASANAQNNYYIERTDGSDRTEATDAKLDDRGNRVTLKFPDNISPGQWRFVIRKQNPDHSSNSSKTIQDTAGNALNAVPGEAEGSDYVQLISRTGISESPLSQRGIGSASTGEHVEFPEYTQPRDYPSGFNPSDKVVTRVARLYYFRDAHRVTQIVNRQAKSYNRQAVDMKQQFADAARRDSDQAATARQEAERKAIRAAQNARAAENALEEHQQALIEARSRVGQLEQQIAVLDGMIIELEKDVIAASKEPTPAETSETATDDNSDSKDSTTDSEKKLTAEQRLRRMKSTRQSLQNQLNQAQLDVDQEENAVNILLSRVQAERTTEIQETERWDALEAEEQLKAEEQFRREVAAKTEDPDTYVPGDPESNDPVTQVSLSVVGEGLIQLRGPRKGVNEVHKMINQIDAPVGQVKVALHTVQVNGEGGERMEQVVMRIQRYLDHSRFLTVQSGQMLRNAVVSVASQRASIVADTCPPGTPQELRDYKYQTAFFGEDFMQELKAMDSEFLRTGNKVLSLHSMDTTSLSNALFLLSLAKNDVREEILAEFMAQVQCKLPQDELDFFTESGAEYKFRHKEFQFLGQNAQFVALRGFFDAQVIGPDTLNPMQREFIRLAQIFKARLITEIELRQRVMERALIEQRIGNMEDKEKEAAEKEATAQRALANISSEARTARNTVLQSVTALNADITEVADYITETNAKWNTWTELAERTMLQLVGRIELPPNTDKAAIERAITNSPEAVFARLFPTATVDKKGDRLAIRLYDFFNNPTNTNDTVTVDCDSLADGGHSTRTNSNNGAKNPPQTQLTAQQEQVRESQIGNLQNSLANHPLNFVFDSNNYEILLLKNEATLVDTRTRKPAWDRLRRSVRTQSARLRNTIAFMKRNISSRGNPDLIASLDCATNYLELIKDHDRDSLRDIARLVAAAGKITEVGEVLQIPLNSAQHAVADFRADVQSTRLADPDAAGRIINSWIRARIELRKLAAVVNLDAEDSPADSLYSAVKMRSDVVNDAIDILAKRLVALKDANAQAEAARRPLDHKKFLDMLVDDVEEKFIELVEGTRAQTSNIDNYLKRLGTALEDDFNAQFYHPAFRYVRETSYYYDVSVGQVETTSIVANNRMFAKVEPQATMEFDLPKRDILINEAMNSALAAYNDYGALMADPNFLSLMQLYSGQPASDTYGQQFGSPYVQEVLPGLPATTDAQFLTSARNNVPRLGAGLDALIPDPAIYKFQTGTGYEIRPVIQPDGQSVVFHLDYMYTTNVREPVRADEKHLGRVKRHFINTDVVSGNYELREVSTYRVGLKASRTSRGVPLLEDIPAVGVLFRPQASQESSLQQNIILTQSVIYPTLFDLMGLRWAPAVADLDSLTLQEREFVTRNREKFLQNEVFDYSSLQVDEFMRIPDGERRGDLYRTQETIPLEHPNGYSGPGLNIRHGHLQNGYQPEQFYPQSKFIPRRSEDAVNIHEEPPRQPIYYAPPEQLLVPQPNSQVECLEGAMSVPQLDPKQRAAMLNPQAAEPLMTPMSHETDSTFDNAIVPARLRTVPQDSDQTDWMIPAEFDSSFPASRPSHTRAAGAQPQQKTTQPGAPAHTTERSGSHPTQRQPQPKQRSAMSRFVHGLFR